MTVLLAGGGVQCCGCGPRRRTGSGQRRGRHRRHRPGPGPTPPPGGAIREVRTAGLDDRLCLQAVMPCLARPEVSSASRRCGRLTVLPAIASRRLDGRQATEVPRIRYRGRGTRRFLVGTATTARDAPSGHVHDTLAGLLQTLRQRMTDAEAALDGPLPFRPGSDTPPHAGEASLVGGEPAGPSRFTTASMTSIVATAWRDRPR